MNTNPANGKRPLDGIRVLELGQLLAGPFAGCILGYYGAEVIKVEPPNGGDPLRTWRVLDDEGCSHWWRSLARNKKCITADLRQSEGRELVRRIALRSDVLIENFRPGTMENWGLGPDDFKQENPGLIYSRVSGYGQDGPYASKPGFASVCEGFGGSRYVNGRPGEKPMRMNISLGDSLAGLHAAFGVVMACLHRERDEHHQGQVIDTALYESIFNMMEGAVPEYDAAGVVREPAGSTITGIVPSNTYRCGDGRDIIIGANVESMFQRLCQLMGREDMAEDPRFKGNDKRVQHVDEIDAAIEQWLESLDAQTALSLLEEARIPSGPIYSVADMFADEHYQARGMFEEVDVKGQALKIPAIIPRLSETPGRSDFAGGDLGSSNDEIYRQWLGLGEDELSELKRSGVI